ncbi:MAG: 2-dehydropantoate 2-reductase [Burkholderiaceae bacterium]
MKVCVVGAGAIGGVLAFRLAAAGHEVSVVARGAHRQAIADRGLTLIDRQDGDRASRQAMAVDEDPAAFGVQDVVVIGLKAHAIPALLPRVASLIGPQTMLIPAINGVPWWYFQHEGGVHDGLVVRSVDPTGDMHATVGASSIVGCVVHAAAEVREPGVVHHTGGKGFIIGEIDRSLADPRTERVLRFADALSDAKLDATVSGDIRKDVWMKLIGNLSFNPVAALTYAHMGRICGSEGLLEVLRPMLIEGMAVASAYGIDIPMTPDQRIDIARYLGAARISMHQDFEAHRKPEIDAIVGAVIELAELENVPVPVTKMLFALVRERAISDGLIVA